MKRRTQSAVLLLAASLLAFGSAGTARAQGVTTSAISGTVLRQGGEPVAGARITVTNLATGTTAQAGTNQAGRYFVPGLLPGGPYTVAVSALGMAAQTRRDLTLALGQNLRVDFQLAEQAVALEGITAVAEQGAIFSPSNKSVATIVDSTAIRNFPTTNRNLNELAALSPHVTVGGDDRISVAGANNRYNNIQIDGAVNNDVFGLAGSGLPGGQANAKPISLEAIQEYQVLLTPFDLRYSNFSGGLINAVTKGGTNRLQGSAFFMIRNEDLVRSPLRFQEREFPVSDFLNRQYGFSLGGPIVRNRVHFFVNGEWEDRNQPSTFGIDISQEADIGVSADSIARFIDILNSYGVDPGSPNQYTVENPVKNLLGRLDFQISDNHRLTLRHNYVNARDLSNVGRGGFIYALTSNAFEFPSTTNTSVLQLFSRFGSRITNEFLGNLQSISDDREPLTGYPTVEVNVTNRVQNADGSFSNVGRRFIAGAETFSQGNVLEQDILQFTDNLTAELGDHRVTVGGSAERFTFHNEFFPNSFGTYRFNSLALFAQNRPATYSINLPYPGLTAQDVAADWSFTNVGFYVQDEWSVTPELSLIFGARADAPFLHDRPRENPDLSASSLGLNTTDVPSGNWKISPRFGFNWAVPGEALTQIRGGIGLFTGRAPAVWLSNLYTNTGREQVTLFCSGTNAPAFNPTTPPTTCANGAGPVPGTAVINTIDPDFEMPQDLKISLGIDRELAWGIRATLEGMYSRALNALLYQELNLAGPQTANLGNTLGLGERVFYGTAVGAGYQAVRRDPAFVHIVHLTNEGKAYQYSLAAELAKEFGETFELRASYAHTRSFDNMSLTSSIATSNRAFTPIRGDINDLEVTRSNFDRPHKVTISATAHLLPQYGGTDVSLFYVGQSGEPYSYTYGGDVNGDQYESLSVSGLSGRNNDLIYVPTSFTDISMPLQDYQRLEELIALDECLQEARGQILERNACRSPWWNRFDLRVAQSVRYGRGRLELFMNIANFGNLLNEDWGILRVPQNNTISVLEPGNRVGNTASGPITFTYSGFTRTVNNVTQADLPYNVIVTRSRYQIQLGSRVSF